MLLVFISLLGTHLHAAQVGAVVTPNPVPVGEGATYQLQVINAQPDVLPVFPEIPGLEISYGGQNRSSKTVINNGRMQNYTTLVYQWKLIPRQEGVFLIPAISFKIDRKVHRTSAVQLRVTKGIDYSQYAFIQLNLSKQSFFEGEPFSFSIDLYEQNARVEKGPDLLSDGFVVQRISDNLRQNRKVIGTKAYNVWSLDYIARAVRHGELQLGPVSWPAALVFRQQSRSRSVFNSFFNDNSKRRDIVLKAGQTPIQIKPLPEQDRPQSFNGAIGQYEIEMEATPLQVTEGDPLTVYIRIRGEGPLEAIPMPPVDHWKSFKTYPPSATTELADNTGLKGVRVFELVTIPQKATITELPSLEFSYFDTVEGAYRSLVHPAIPLKVLPSQIVSSNAGSSQSNYDVMGLPKPKPKDLVPIKAFLGKVVAKESPWVLQSSFYWAQLVPPILLGLAWVVRRQKERSSQDVLGRRRRHVEKFTRKHLPELEKLARKNDSDSFFELLFRLLQTRLSQSMDLPAASITEAVLDEPQRVGNISNSDVELLHTLFQACNQARYAPIDSSQQLAEYASQCKDVLTRLA
jgi:hypothetical protein